MRSRCAAAADARRLSLVHFGYFNAAASSRAHFSSWHEAAVRLVSHPCELPTSRRSACQRSTYAAAAGRRSSTTEASRQWPAVSRRAFRTTGKPMKVFQLSATGKYVALHINYKTIFRSEIPSLKPRDLLRLGMILAQMPDRLFGQSDVR